LDWEGNQNAKFGTGQDVAWCLAWLNEVYRLTGVRPFIYMSKSVCRVHNWSPVAGQYPLWCAQYGSNAATDYQNNPWTDSYGFGAWKSDTIRQYSSKGRITGYSANIDIDKAYLTAEQWRAMAKGTKAATPQVTQNPIDVALSIANAEVGTHEGANNKTKYGDEMHALQPRNMDKNAPWCDAFVDWVILQTCKRFGYGAEMARKVLCGDFDDYTYASVALYKKTGRWTQNAARGHQIFFGGSGHTGLVEKVSGGVVYTIEGNKGDEVRKCSYSVHSPSIIGYGRPKYELITGTPEPVEDDGILRRGSKGKAVKFLQLVLGGLEPDGSFGPKTDAKVRSFQKSHGLTVDGEVGPNTWAAIKRTLPLIKRGSTGRYVEALQVALGGLTVDGSFGKLTYNAVTAFQRESGLQSDGEVGQLTWGVIIADIT
jgi:peptidoglycan hydrolase-like protein with peptidoglycan-binding domain